MPIVETDLKEYKSVNAESDGGAIDLAREITPGVDNNLWPDISGAEAAAGGTRYRKVFRRNTHASLTWQAPKSWIKQQPSGATISVGIGIDSADDADPTQGNMTAFTATALVALISDGADTRVATIIGESGAGARQTETVALTGAVEVLSVNTYAKVYAVYLASLSASRTVTVKQGSGGTARGSIGINKKICWLWRTGTDIDTKAEGYQHGDIAPSTHFGLWERKVWPPGSGPITATSQIVRSEGDTDA